MNIFGLQNELSDFSFLMGKFALIYKRFGLQAYFRNELCSKTKIPLFNQKEDTAYCKIIVKK